MKIFSPKVK